MRAVEGVHFGFSFNVPDPQVHINSPGTIGQPEIDQLPGACKNWFSVERWVDISGANQGVTWSSSDAPLMEHALANVLVNAARYTPADSLIRVSAGVEGSRMFLCVDDNGPGLPPEIAANLFQKFRRGHDARAGGLGLGLSIVRGFMLAQGGEVTAGKSPEGGARFMLYLPYSEHGRVPDDEN